VDQVNTVKTALVRIRVDQETQLRDILQDFPVTITSVVQRALDLWLEVEGPVYRDALRKMKDNLKRQPVVVANR
jgi:hypothetical protein